MGVPISEKACFGAEKEDKCATDLKKCAIIIVPRHRGVPKWHFS
jgi:hypothetical protein